MIQRPRAVARVLVAPVLDTTPEVVWPTVTEPRTDHRDFRTTTPTSRDKTHELLVRRLVTPLTPGGTQRTTLETLEPLERRLVTPLIRGAIQPIRANNISIYRARIVPETLAPTT
jgi:hypothetical protein